MDDLYTDQSLFEDHNAAMGAAAVAVERLGELLRKVYYEEDLDRDIQAEIEETLEALDILL